MRVFIKELCIFLESRERAVNGNLVRKLNITRKICIRIYGSIWSYIDFKDNKIYIHFNV